MAWLIIMSQFNCSVMFNLILLISRSVEAPSLKNWRGGGRGVQTKSRG